jgi:hypothetical protein
LLIVSITRLRGKARPEVIAPAGAPRPAPVVPPLLLAFVAERASDPAALAVVAAFALVALVCFALVRAPRII